MKLVYKCEYCSFMSTNDAVASHERNCLYNPSVKKCDNCKYASRENTIYNDFSCAYDCYKLKCSYKMYQNIKDNDNSFVFYSESLPYERICEHYERMKEFK